jgi:hypothetical protein
MGELDFANDQLEAPVPAILLSPEAEAKYDRIVRNLQEATSTEIIRKVLADGEVPRMYWGE